MRSLRFRSLLPALVTAAALLLYLLRFQYAYAASDQDELIPYLLHRLDPSLFAYDWFVQTQAASFNVRTYVVLLLHGLAWLLPVWAAVLVAYVASWTLIGTAVYALARLITGQRLAAALTVVAALVLTPQWTLGGNDLVHRMFVPSMLGWGLGLWGLVFVFRHRPGMAGLLLGLATWAQALVGLQLAGLAGVLLIVAWLRHPAERPQRLRSVLSYIGVYALAAAPSLVPILAQQLGPSPPSTDTADLFYIQAVFRTPHHYLPSAFPARSLLRFGMLLMLGCASLVWLRHRGRDRHTAALLTLLATMAGLCTLAFIGTEIRPVLSIAELQLFKVTVLAKVLLLTWIAQAFTTMLPRRIRHGLADLVRFPWLTGAGALGLLTLALVLMIGTLGRVPGLRWSSAPAPLDRVESWAKATTPRDAVFAIPPSVSSFRSRAERAIVVNFKAFPHRDAAMVTWFQRLQDLAPIGRPRPGGTALLDDLDRAYEQLSLPELNRLAHRYGVTYVLRTTALPVAPVYSDAHVWVYRLPLEAPPPTP